MPTPKIVVIGSSYSAAAAFNYLERSLAALREPFDLLLLSNKNHYLNKDLLSQYLCDSCNLEDTCQWLRGIVFLRAGVSYLESDILNIGFQSKTIFTSKGEISYQYLVLAPHNDLYDEPAFDKESNAFIIKNPGDVLRLRIHILSNIEKAVSELREKTKRGILVEVETRTLEEVADALKAGVDIILFDNMNIAQLKEAVETVKNWKSSKGKRKPLTEASGNITLENVRLVAQTGVDRISIGAITHSAKALDISLEINLAKNV